MKTIIIGAGLAGLQLGKLLNELGKKFVIFEKEPQIGGLCRTNTTSDFSWDFGVHAIYGRNENVMKYFISLPIHYQSIVRNVNIFHSGNNGKDYLLDYPFEMGIRDLPIREKLECIYGYIAAHAKKEGDFLNLEGWINNFLGTGIAKHFMIPYNKKIWNCNLAEISEKLVNQKIEPAPVKEFLSNILGKKRTGRKYQSKFIYPKQGIQQVINCIAKDIKKQIKVGAGVKRLIRNNDKWTVITENGINETSDIVVSTMPIVELIKIINVSGIEKRYSVFKWNDTVFVMIGLKRGYNFKKITDCHWAFFKEDELFYRVTMMNNFSPDFSPALVAEITRKDNIVGMSDDKLMDSVVTDLIRKGIIDSEDKIAETDIRSIQYTYPIPTIGLTKVKDRIRGSLKSHNLFMLGRNGNWDYINMPGVVNNVQKLLPELLAIKI